MRSMTLTYEWQQFYKAAISEADQRKMRDDIMKAEHAIQRRLAIVHRQSWMQLKNGPSGTL